MSRERSGQVKWTGNQPSKEDKEVKKLKTHSSGNDWWEGKAKYGIKLKRKKILDKINDKVHALTKGLGIV